MFTKQPSEEKIISGIISFCLVFTLGACAHNGNKAADDINNSEAYITSINLEGAVSAETLINENAQKAITAMQAGRLQEATNEFNITLNKNFTSSSLQLLNGINYHLRAIGGDNGLFDMAEQGYLAAIRFDKSNWTARYYLGLFYLDTKRYLEAQRQFGAYVVNNDRDPEALYYLALSSYYSADPITAHASAMQLWELVGTQKASSIDSVAMLRLLAMTKAAVNKPAEASKLLDDYMAKGGEVDHASILRKRLEDWQHVYANHEEYPADEAIQNSEEDLEQLIDATDDTVATDDFDSMEEEIDDIGMTDESDSMTEMDSSDEMLEMEDNDESFDSEIEEDENDSEFVEGQMVAVDVVIIRSEEVETEAKGINLLDGLNLQFGSVANGLDAFSSSNVRAKDLIDPTASTFVKTISKLITVPAVNYTLNILNEQDGRSEVLARPTLVSRAGQTSEFFSGVEISAAAVSGGAGDSVSIEKEVGLKLAITPEIGPDDVVFLHVIAERTFLTQPSSSVVFEFRLDTTKTLVDANVAMKFGQTLILSGLDERITESNLDGVPGLKEAPFLQRLFSEENVLNQKRSVVILLTPRPASYLYANPGTGLTTVGDLNPRPTIEQLSDRYESWFKPISNAQTIINRLSTGELYKYFQSRDLPLDAWYKSDSHSLRMREIIKQLRI